MNKQQRDEAIAVEAEKYTAKIWGVRKYAPIRAHELSKEDYMAGANSRANLEWVVRRAVELAREEEPTGVEDSGIKEMMYMNPSPDEILAQIQKELE